MGTLTESIPVHQIRIEDLHENYFGRDVASSLNIKIHVTAGVAVFAVNGGKRGARGMMVRLQNECKRPTIAH